MGVLPWNWFRYAKDKLEYSKTLARMSSIEGSGLFWYKVYRTMRHELMTMTKRYEDNHHMPILGVNGVLLVRKIPQPNPQILHVGDLVLHKDPTDLDKHIIRRIAAFGQGCDIAPADFRNIPFPKDAIANIPSTLGKDECWVLTDSLIIPPKDFHDSRTFGPLYMPHIIGRPVFKKNEYGAGPVWNSNTSEKEDEAVLEVEMEYYRKIAREERARRQQEEDDDDDY